MPQSTRLTLFAQLPPSVLSAPDDSMTSYIDFWTRMHSTTCKLVAVALKYVEWSPDDAAAHRYV